MDTSKNSYTIIYATILVVFVAAVLAFVSMSLKDRQNANVSNEKQQNLLAAVGLGADSAFEQVMKQAIVVDGNGNILNTATENIAESEAFKANTAEQYAIIKNFPTLTDEEKKAARAELKLPVFVCTLPDGSDAYIFSAYGAGLWGPIWGWVALKTDFSTIAGVKFDHKGETPGLGAEIATAHFGSQFNGKEIFTNGELTSIAIVKGGANPESTNEVDAISGGTITSNALQQTIQMWFDAYLPYISACQKLAATPMPLAEESEAAAEEAQEVENK